MLGLALASGCRPTAAARGPSLAPPSAKGASATIDGIRGPVTLHSWFDLPDDPRSKELSGIAWDDATRTLWAVQDGPASIVPLLPDRDLVSWRLGRSIQLELAFPVDLEGIVLVPGAFVVASEKGPLLLEVDRRGKLRRQLALPIHYSGARDNKSLEALSISPDGKRLFTTSEGALPCDGPMPTPTTGTRVRILRMGLSGNELDEHAYLTDPLPNEQGGDYGVADLVAVSDDDVLVLERGWTRGVGNTSRIYRVNLADDASSCLSTPALAADKPVLEKVLLVDLKTLHAKHLPVPEEPQPAPLLDNYEGMACGPLLPDGRRSLILVSDDNARSEQRARIVVLSLG